MSCRPRVHLIHVVKRERPANPTLRQNVRLIHPSSYTLVLRENTAGRPSGDDDGATRGREKLYTLPADLPSHLKGHSSFNLDGAAVSLSHTHNRDFCQHGNLFQRVRERKGCWAKRPGEDEDVCIRYGLTCSAEGAISKPGFRLPSRCQ